jgi:transmembrane sensor
MTSDAQIRSPITQAAAEWYAAHRSGPLPESERVAFLDWLKASPLHVEEYLGVAALERTLGAATAGSTLSVEAWVELARVDGTERIVELATPSVLHEPAGPPPGVSRRRAIAVAACLSMAGIVSVWLMWGGHAPGGGHGPGEAKSYRTAHGEQGVWPLEDGSTLHVNTDTAVQVQFSSAERLLEVDHGEVSVDVAHNDGRPFRVHAGTADAVAVGTEFDVYRRSDATLFTVAQGQIAVSVGRFAQTRLQVGAGRQVKVVAGILPPASEPTNLRETLAWLERKIVFDQRPLGAVAEEFNRYNQIPFTIEDPALRRLSISGSFDAADIDSFAAFLDSLDGVRVERLPTRFNVLNSKNKSGSTARST